MIVLTRPWTEQPPYWQASLVRGRGAPLAAGLVDGLTFGGGLQRLVPGDRPVIAGSSIIAGRYGLAAKLNGSSGHIQIPAVRGIDGQPRIQVTAIVGSATQSGEMLMELSAVADSNAGFYLYGISSSQLRILSRSSAGGAPSSDHSITLSAAPGVLTVRIDVSVVPHLIGLWYNGAEVYEGNSATGAIAGTFTQTTLNIGSRNASSLRSDGTFGDVWVHNRWMPKAQLAQWHRNVWEIYEPRRIIVPVSASAGATDLTGASCVQAAASAAAAVSQTHELTGSGSNQAAGCSGAAVSQVHAIAAADSAAASTSGTGAVVQTHVLAAAGSSAASSSAAGAITQVHALVGAGSQQDAASSVGSIAGTIFLAGSACSSAAASSAGAVGQVHVLAAAACASAAASAAAAVLQVHQLVAVECSSSAFSASGAVVLGEITFNAAASRHLARPPAENRNARPPAESRIVRPPLETLIVRPRA